MEKVEKTSFWKQSIIGAGWALGFSMLLVLVFAFLLRLFGFGEGAINVIVQIIKGASVLMGVMIAMKHQKEMGFLTGLGIGLVFTVISFVVFSCLDGFRFEFSGTLLNDLIFGGIIGGICGIIAVNLKK
ncbi:MAG: TIGR04086 family membrane protein [Clostridia bacterium]|nr:TIGR04086 family membrane protein [Clostridia bacterium]